MRRLREHSIGSITHSAKEWLTPKGGPSSQSAKMTYKRIMRCFMKKLYYKLVTTGAKIKLPWFGTLQVCKYNVEEVQIRKENMGKKRLTFVDFNALAKMRSKGVEPTKIPTCSFKSTKGMWWYLIWKKHSSYFEHRGIYTMHFSNSNIKPNSVNEKMPEVHVSSFFLDKGYITYRELNIKEFNYD